MTDKIRQLVKHHHEQVSSMKITSFRHVLKFKEAVPHLVRLLHAGGVWTVNCESAYAALVKCRVERVYQIFHYIMNSQLTLFLYLTGYCLCYLCLCRPGRNNQWMSS